MAEEHAHEQTALERPRVLVFFDYACPFCYVDQHRFDSLEAELDLDFDIFLVPFELRPEMSDEAVDLTEAGAGHSQRVDEYLERAAEKEGFPFIQPTLLPSTHRALVLGEVARDLGDAVHRTVHAAIFTAYFGDGKDIGSREVLLGIAGELGIERDELEECVGGGHLRRAAAPVPARRDAPRLGRHAGCADLQRALHRVATRRRPA
jgi:predicted DsbA family dithiol-disulfide isomerase